MGRMARRLFIGSGGALIALGGVSILGCGLRGNRQGATLERLSVMLADIVDPIRIGQAACETIGIAGLQEEAGANVHVSEALTIQCAATRRARLRAGCQADFAQGRIVVCDRYVLSRTEMLVAGLLHADALS